MKEGVVAGVQSSFGTDWDDNPTIVLLAAFPQRPGREEAYAAGE